MSKPNVPSATAPHSHYFLGAGHERSERKTWAVICLCSAMMIAEIVGGLLFGSIALVADGMHMSTHAGALLLAALAYSYARRHANDSRFTFGTGKLGDLAGFTSAIVLAMISLLIGYEAVTRLLNPVPIQFAQAIPIAFLGLLVNISSAWILASGSHDHTGHSHRHGHRRENEGSKEVYQSSDHPIALEVYEDGVPPRFRIRSMAGLRLSARHCSIETIRADGTRQTFNMEELDGHLESIDEIPEPHEFIAQVRAGDKQYSFEFVEHHYAHSGAHRDNNMRAAVIHVMADATVSVLVIVGLLLARTFGWMWMDPLAGIIGACVIASWSYGLVRDTGAILLDMNPDRHIADSVRHDIESDGDQLSDLHLWRLGPGHLGAIMSVLTARGRSVDYYSAKLARFPSLSHVTIEVRHTDKSERAA